MLLLTLLMCYIISATVLQVARVLNSSALFPYLYGLIYMQVEEGGGAGENLKQVCKLKTQSWVCTSFENSPKPRVFLWVMFTRTMLSVAFMK